MSDILERVKAMPGALTTVSLDPPPRCTGWHALCMFARCQFRKWGAMARAKVRLPRPARGRGVLTVRVTGLQVEDAKSVLTKFRMTGANRVRDRLRTRARERTAIARNCHVRARLSVRRRCRESRDAASC
jgi:hypothetical protein